MDDLLVANAYKNETTGMDTGSLWKIIQTSPKNRSPSHLRGSNFKALSGGKRQWCFGLVVAPQLCCQSVALQSQKQFSRWFSLVRDSFRNPVINIPPVCFV